MTYITNCDRMALFIFEIKVSLMKKIGYLFFALLFNLSRIFPVQKRKIVLFNGHNTGLNGNLLEIKKAIEEKKPSVRFLFFAKREMFRGGLLCKIKGTFHFFVLLPFHMATSSVIFMNDNFLPLGWCFPSKKTKIVQLWHGAGAFKRFGLSAEKDENVRTQVIKANRRLTHLFVTSAQVVPFYREAFAVPESKIFVTGIPITDMYFKEENKEEAKQRFYTRYPELQGKKLLLYTPTFRRIAEENEGIMEHFNVEKIHKLLGDSWVILVKMHPKYPAHNVFENSFCYNFTNYSQIADLYFVSDLLVTDYSSTVVEYVLLDKPIILYAYDLEKYDRGFYRDYEKTVPGGVAHTQEELLEYLTNLQKDTQKRQNFAKLQYDYRDGNSSERILDVLEETKR